MGDYCPIGLIKELPTILCEIEDPNSFVPGSLKKSYYYADGQILSQRVHAPNDPSSYTPYFYVHDRLGSVRMVVDDTGAAVCSYTYRPYGAFYEGECVETAGVDNPWKFTGQYYDAEIEQYYLRARQYDPTMMRFTSRDPKEGDEFNPLTIHKYLYCANEPVNRVDKKGEDFALICTLGSIIIGEALRRSDLDAKYAVYAYIVGAVGTMYEIYYFPETMEKFKNGKIYKTFQRFRSEEAVDVFMEWFTGGK